MRALLLLFSSLLAPAFACETVYLPPCQLGSYFPQIFIGTVIEEHPESLTYLFHIDEPLKGLAPGIKEIKVGPQTCDIGYKLGTQYLVLASNAPGPVPHTSHGERVKDVPQSVDFFRKLARGEHLTLISGRVAENVEDLSVRYELDVEHRPGVSAVDITASKDGQILTTQTDSHGAYSLQVPEPGKYQITAKLAGHATADPAYELDLEPDTCQELNLGMWTASRITGHLSTADGKPAAHIPVQLIPDSEDLDGNEPLSTRKAFTDASGKFEWTNVPLGDYLLGVNLYGPNSKVPYDTRFYPGVTNRSKATLLHIKDANSIEGVDFRIGERKSTRPILITVEWPDGKPVINASIECSSSSPDPDAKSDWMLRYVDLEGKATCEVLTGEDFVVDADGLSWQRSSGPIEPVDTRPKLLVPAGADPVHLKIVIDRVNDISAHDAPENMSRFNDADQ